jgi:hypothetical protein
VSFLDISGVPLDKQSSIYLSNALATGPFTPVIINNQKFYYGSSIAVLKLENCFHSETRAVRNLGNKLVSVAGRIGIKDVKLPPEQILEILGKVNAVLN